jgi:hypothetical protein
LAVLTPAALAEINLEAAVWDRAQAQA